MAKRATIVDVAKHAGVSKSTVSLVLQNSPLVRPATRETVQKSMKELSYVYNRSAAQLRGVGVGLIGLVINDLRNPFFTEFASTVQRAFADAGFATVIADTDENEATQTQVIGSMIEHGVSGLIVSPAYGGDGAIFDRLETAGIPTMQVLRQVDDRTDIFPVLSLDYDTGGEIATRHLIDSGARRIAFVGGLEDRTITLDRMAGYLRVMAETGLTPQTFFGRPSRAFGRDIAHHLHQNHQEIEGAYCFSDLVALGMISGFAELGVTVGRDFSIVGFDDIEECALVYPQISSVCCHIAGFGRLAAETLLTWIETGTRPPTCHRSPVDLIIRQSSRGQGA